MRDTVSNGKFCEIVREATEKFEAEQKRVHDHLVFLGYEKIREAHGETVYRSPGRKEEVIVPAPGQHIPKSELIQSQLYELFPKASIEVSVSEQHVTARLEGEFIFRFQDMSKLAEIFGTDHINFRQEAGTEGYSYSSWTWDSGTEPQLYLEADYA